MTSNLVSLLNSRLVRGGVLTTILRVLMIGFMLLGNRCITQNLSKVSTGIYLTTYGVVYFLAVLGQLGLRTAVVRRIAECRVGDKQNEVRSAIKLTRTMLHGSFLSIICVGWVSFFLASAAGFQPLSILNLCLASVWLVTVGIQYTLPEVFRAREQYGLAGLLSGTLSTGLIYAGLLAVQRFSLPLTLTKVFVIVAVAGLFNYSVIMFLLWRLVGTLPKGHRRSYRQSLDDSLPMLGTHISTACLTLLDTTLVGFLAGPAQAALYGVAARLSVLINLPFQIVCAVVAPTLASSYAKRNTKEMERVARSSSFLSSVPALILVAFYFVFGDVVLHWFGPDYVEASTMLKILSVSQLATVLAGPVNAALMLSGHQRAAMKLGFYVLGLFALMQLGLTPMFGGIGCAIAVLVSVVSLVSLQSHASRSLVGVNCHIGVPSIRDLASLPSKS